MKRCNIFLCMNSIFSFLVCNYTLTPPSYMFSSPGYPNKYPNNAYCEYHFKVPEGNAVQIYSQYFSLEYHRLCVNDSVKFYERNVLKATMCGYIPNGTWTSTGNEVLAVFKSDASVTSYGFYGFFTVIRKRKSNILSMFYYILYALHPNVERASR